MTKYLKKLPSERINCRNMVLIAAGCIAILLSGCGETETGDSLVVDARLAGQPVAESTPLDPIELHHEEVTELSLTVTNVTGQPVTVAHVRLEGQLLNLIFLTYDTGLHETLQPNERRTVTFTLDFFDLDGQAHGLLRSHIRLFDTDRNPLGQQALIVDGRGSPFATMAVFNMVLVAVALAGLVWNMMRLAQRRLPANRFVRGLRFLHSGAVLGLAAAAASSTLRIWPLPITTWLPIVIASAMGGFVIGYFAPGADHVDDDDTAEIIIDLAEVPHGLAPGATDSDGAVSGAVTPGTAVSGAVTPGTADQPP